MRDTLQLALSCVTSGVLLREPGTPEADLTLTSRLTYDGARLTLTIEHRFTLIRDMSQPARDRWEARTSGYLYTLDDPDGREILAYHWHPRGHSDTVVPHLHLGAGAGALRRELMKAHLLTGFVSPVPLLLLVIESFGESGRDGQIGVRYWRGLILHCSNEPKGMVEIEKSHRR